MAFCQLVLKARNLEKARQLYEDEKLRSIDISKGAKPRYTLKQRLRQRKLRCKRKLKEFFNQITSCPRDSWFHRKAVSLRTDGTFENYILKSVLGFVGGVFLTYIFFVFFVFQLNFRLSSATFLCTVIGVVLTLGLAFSYRVRCVVFLLLPQFFSKRGRQALMAYAFILALTGPAKNILHNTGVLSESLACGQEQLKEAVKNIVDLVKQPFYALREAISKVIKTIKVVVKKIKETLVAIKRLVLSILRVITSVFEWLGSIVNMCNKKLGTPFDRCQRVFEGAVADCKAKLGPVFGVICNLTYIVGALCYIVKPLDFICMLVSYVADTVVGAVRRKIKRFTMHMKAMFYVKVKFSHSFHFEANQSKTIEEVSKGIVTEIRSRTDDFLAFFDWMSVVTAFFVFFILLRVMHYRHKWLTSERFDNKYITADLRTIDLIRTRQEKETVLPLNRRERNRYIPLSSITLIRTERTKLAKSIVFLGLATFKLVIYMMVDYSLYWILSTIRFHGRFETKVQRPNVVSVHVSGNGYLAELYRSIIKAFTPHGKETQIDSMPCLPDPIPPNLDRYAQIISLIVFCWLMTILEPYGLRLRHVVMRHYHPDRAKQRAVWLYNHIIRSRGSFLKFARRQLRRKFGMTQGEAIEKVTLRERLTAVCPFLNILCPLKQNACILCGAVERSDDNLHIKCATPGCAGLFCTQCFADLQNLCTICRSPVEYGDLSDMSEEKDSSDDQLQKVKIVKPELKEPKEEFDEKEKPKKEKPEEEKAEAEIDEKKDELVQKDKAEQTDGKSVEDIDRSSESDYSYSYQDESSGEIEIAKEKIPFKDIEAQKIKDSVTIQIFNEQCVKETSSSAESPTSCFVVRARRRVRAKLKKKSCSSKDSGSSTSIADTESWPTEEVDEEEVIHIEVDDGCEKSLLKDRKDKVKRGRINKIVGAVARIPWLGKGDNADKSTNKGLQTRRPSLMNKIVSMLQGKRSNVPVQTYRRTRRMKKDTSSSSSSSYEGESKALIKTQDRSVDTGRLTRRKVGKKPREDDSDDSVYTEDANLRHPREKKFPTKELPRYLKEVERDTSYFEIDETDDSRARRKSVRQVEDVNVLSGVRTFNGRGTDAWNITGDDEFPGTCSCTSEITYDTSVDKKVRPVEMGTISERTDADSKIDSDTESEKISMVKTSTEYSGDTESSEVKSRRDRKRGKEAEQSSEGTGQTDDSGKTDDSYDDERLRVYGESSEGTKTTDDSSDVERLKDSGETSEGTKMTDDSYDDERLKISERTFEGTKERDGVSDSERSKDSPEGTPTEKKKIMQGKSRMKSLREKEKDEKPILKKEVRPTSTGSGGPQLYDPLAGLELYGVHYKSKKKKEPTTRGEPKEEINEQPNLYGLKKTSVEVEDGKDEKEKKDQKDTKTEKDVKEEKDTKTKKDVKEEKDTKTKKDVKEEKDTKTKKDAKDEKDKKDIKEEKGQKYSKDKKEQEETKDKRDEVKDAKSPLVKVDKATASPEKSRGTQTKLKKKRSIKKGEKESESIKHTQTEDSDYHPDDMRYDKKKKKKCSDKRKRRKKRHREDRDSELGSSPRRRKHGISEKSTLTEDDELRSIRREKKRHRHVQTKEEHRPQISTRGTTEEHQSLSRRKELRLDDERQEDHRPESTTGQFVSGFRPIIHPTSSDRFHDRTRETGISFPRGRDRDPEEWAHGFQNRLAEHARREITEYPRYDYPVHGRSYCDYYGGPQHPRCCVDSICQHPWKYVDPCERRSFFAHRARQPQPCSAKMPEHGFQAPVLKKYLPMYQSPELIEELKGHDRMRLIREKEFERRKYPSSDQMDEVSTCSRIRTQRSNRSSIAPHPQISDRAKLSEDGEKLPYQETEAYKNVMCEFRKTVCRRNNKKPEEMVPLIDLSIKADKTKEVEQLFPRENRDQRKSSAVARFTNKLVGAFKPCSNKKQRYEKRNSIPEEIVETYHDRTFDPETLSEVSSVVECSHKAHRFDISTSADETTDNNETTR